METEASILKIFDYIQSVPFDNVNLKILTYMISADLYATLPHDIKRDNKRYVLACKENGLNQFSLEELIQKLTQFRDDYHRSIYKNQQPRYFYNPPYLLTNTVS